jgi:hypothetical protein
MREHPLDRRKRPMGPRIITIVAMLTALAIGTTACADRGDVRDGDPDVPVSTPGDVEPPSDVPPEEPAVVEPRPGMADTYPRTFETVTLGDDDRTLTIDFWSGVEPCYVLDRVDVRYRPQAIVVTLYEGHEPSDDDDGPVCIEIAMIKRVIVELDEPVDGREILDGAAG